MKLKTTAIAAIAISVMIGCSKPASQPTVLTSNNTICMNYQNDSISRLPVDLVYDMVRGYETNQLKSIQDTLNLIDSRAVWFDLKTLKKFLYHIEMTTTKSNGRISPEDLGLRIYFARYPGQEEWGTNYDGTLAYFNNSDETKQYAKKHTLIMVPTIKGDVDHIDFNPDDESTYTNGLPNYADILDYDMPLPLLMPLPTAQLPLTNPSITAQNHGGLFPPKKSNGLVFTKY